MTFRYKIGSNNVSAQQEEYIDQAKELLKSGDLNELRRIITIVTNDPEIKRGDEDLHHDWEAILTESRYNWEDAAPKELRQQFSNILNAFHTPGHNLSSLIPNKTSMTFLLGVGASKPEPSGIPTVKELLKHLLERAERLDRPDLNRIISHCKHNNITNIEDLLTAAHLANFFSTKPQVLRLFNYLARRQLDQADGINVIDERAFQSDLSSASLLQDTLHVLFSLLSNMMLPARPNDTHMSIARHLSTSKNCHVVTTNYDCCIDLALGDQSVAFDYSLNFKNTPYKRKMQKEDQSPKLIKLHGSLNWWYCDTCREIHEKEAKKIIDGYLIEDSTYPVIALCKTCGGQQRALLVPPLSMKFDATAPLSPLLSDASRTFSQADLIVSVGFSFSDADLYLTRLIANSMKNKENQKLVIFDTDGDVSRRMTKRLAAGMPGFKEGRVLDVTGDCNILLPKFLNGEFLPSAIATRTKSRAKSPTKKVPNPSKQKKRS